MNAMGGRSEKSRKAFAFLRIGLGMGQMMGAVMAAVLLLQTGFSLPTQVAVTATMTLTLASLLLRGLGCWDVK